MASLSTTRRNAVLLVVLLFFQLILMSGSVRGAEGASVLESWTMRVSSPVVAVADWIGGAVQSAIRGTQELFAAHSRNAHLEAEVRELRAVVQQHREAAQENTRLRNLLMMREELVPGAIAASVVTSSLTDQTHLYVINRGRRDGVRRDLPVVTWGGAVGRVINAYEGYAKVQLLTDPNSGVAGLVQRSRAQGLVVGKGDGPLDLLYAPRFSDVVPGDRVVTSGLDGIFPKGFGIGRVSSISETPGGAQTFSLWPVLDYSDLEEVVVLLEPVGGGLLTSPTLVDEQ